MERFLLLFVFLIMITSAQAAEQEIDFTSFDGFHMAAKLAIPNGQKPKKVIILLHGSGPIGMDADFSLLSKDNQKNLFFKTLSDRLTKEGFAVFRYHKRSYQIQLRLKSDPNFKNNPLVVQFSQNPLRYFVEDARSAVQWVKTQLPETDIYLLGHSQGTYLALQVLNTMPDIKGVALIGFSAISLDVLTFEQVVYRSLYDFGRLDRNQDGQLEKIELGTDPLSQALAQQMEILDSNQDQRIDQEEFKAGNFSNLLVVDLLGTSYRKQEAEYPRLADILKSTTKPVLFFQGEWDNQTPVYQVKGVELVARHIWKKDNFHFWYFPKMGHVLDPRKYYSDVLYSPIDSQVLEQMVTELRKYF